MTGAVAPSLRELARHLPAAERSRRIATALGASDARLLRAVVAAGVGAGEWPSTSHVAFWVFDVDERTFRRWLSSPLVVLPGPVRGKLEKLAFAFAVEVSDA